jgi:hypothetical protein
MTRKRYIIFLYICNAQEMKDIQYQIYSYEELFL